MTREASIQQRFGGISQGLVHLREVRLLQGLLDTPTAPRTALDLPSGVGRLTPLLLGRPGLEQVVCADLNRDRLLRLVAGFPAARPHVAQVDLFSGLPFPDRAFDVVLSIRFLHHVREPARVERALRELLRVTRGALLVSYYGTTWTHSAQRTLLRALGSRRARKLAALSPAHFAQLATQAGGVVQSDRAILPGLHAQRIAHVEPAAAG